MIDAEIKQEIEKYKLRQKRSAGGNLAVAAAPGGSQLPLGVFGDDVIEIVDGAPQDRYGSSDGEGNDDANEGREDGGENRSKDNDQ